ncbi:MAG: acetoacetate--CoA ligase [Gammaproteobacteria bacterium]|nr:acetoacetate--CoA ligase [Gammaproteobacteria bacterium]
MTQPIWTPSAEAVQTSNMTRFTRQAARSSGRDFPNYDALHEWSISDPGAFWTDVWRFTGIQASRPADAAVQHFDRWPGARWFEGAQLNYAENLLRHDDQRPALVSYLETGERREISYATLKARSLALAGQLAKLGIQPSDRVAGWLPNGIEAIIAMLATAALGGVWSSCSPDFGADGALDRFGQIEPKLLIACDGYHYNGKAFDIRAKVAEVAARTPSIERIIWVSVTGAPAPDEHGNLAFAPLLDGSEAAFAQLDFDHPLYILYSSGTTGKPKCIVHGAGGTLLQHAKEHQLHTGLGPDDTLFFFTTCGWMMWNWLVGALATGCTLVLYDGSPFHPDPTTLWRIAEREGVTVFGASPTYLGALAKAGLEPGADHDLSALRMLLSTGSTLSAEGFEYVHRAIKSDLHLVSMTGGTDLISCFILGDPNGAVHSGELQCKGLGMAVDIYGDDGRPLPPGQGEKGELVCTHPFPSCPLGFWGDADGSRFHDAYFAKFPHVWAHGDFAEATANGGFIIHGRSDAVLNPGGVRIGTAEIYRQVERIDEVRDAVCVGQEWDGDTRILLFVALQPGIALNAGLIDRIKGQIRTHATPRHVPRKVIAVSDVPRTRSGKIAELAVRDTIHGRPVKNTAALANPEALEGFRSLQELNA